MNKHGNWFRLLQLSVGIAITAGILAAPALGKGTLTSGVQGQAIVYPGPPLIHVRPYPLPYAIIQAEPAGSSTVVAQTTADSKGNFKLGLAPGAYTIIPLAPSGETGDYFGFQQSVTVPANTYITITAHYTTPPIELN